MQKQIVEISIHQFYRKLGGSTVFKPFFPLQRCKIHSTIMIQITFISLFFFPLVNTCACYCVWLPASKYKNPIPVAQIKFKFTKTFFYFFSPRFNMPSFSSRKKKKKKLTVLFSKNKKLKSAHLSQLSLHCENHSRQAVGKDIKHMNGFYAIIMFPNLLRLLLVSLGCDQFNISFLREPSRYFT